MVRRRAGRSRRDVLELLARVLDHVPDPSQQLVRYWGWHSNAARGRRERQQVETRASPRMVTDPYVHCRHRRLTWSQLIRKVCETDPQLCPYCGTSMRIVALLVDFAPLRRLLAHLGCALQPPEPLAHSPPDEAETFAAHA